MPFRFRDLPPELRNSIYELILDPSVAKRDLGEGKIKYNFDLALFHVNRQVYYEAHRVFRKRNIWVRVETPWDEAQEHVQIEGNVPVLAVGHHADQFNVSLRVVIDAPPYSGLDRDNRRFIVLADDLEAFCRMWYYSDLSYAGNLNRHLRLALHIQDPLASGDSEPIQLTKSLRQKLLLPFGLVKNLREVRVTGPGAESDEVQKSMREAMAVPYDSPEQCVEEATKLKDAGNVALKTDPRRAIELYIEAFGKLHIICIGRRRSIWGDAWFDTNLRGGMFDGKHGQTVRLILRVRLVANVVKAYLDLKDYHEAHFWGMRTIQLMRETVGGEDSPFLDFPAANEMGKIYYRTGLASKMLGDDSEARKLLRVAAEYLPRDEKVKDMLASVSPRLC